MMKEYRDYYFRKAKAEDYPARSVYKLKELDSRYHLLKKGMKVLDLGAAPGSWSMGAAEKVGSTGIILACDLQDLKISLPKSVIFSRTDIFNPDEDFKNKLQVCGPFDLVMSDMAPATTGSRNTDQARSLNLALEALALATANLKAGANFIVKIFMGPDLEELLAPMKANFATVKNFKPKSSRSESWETFYLGLGYKKN